jgi:RNA polymerase sigma factor (sigma-70 family)
VSHSLGALRWGAVQAYLPRTMPAFDSNLLRTDLAKFVRAKVAGADAADVDDIVQATLVELFSAKNRPDQEEELRKYAFGIARHKVADHFRQRRRLQFDVPELAADDPGIEAEDIRRWAEQSLPDTKEAKKTLDWMMREGEGEKLEAIAAAEKLPPPRVRQRVSRLRKHLRDHWVKELALVAALGVLAFLVSRVVRKDDGPIAKDPVPPSKEQVARELVRETLSRCSKGEHQLCKDNLDQAERLDPSLLRDPETAAARKAAVDALTPPAPTPAPTSSDLSAPPKDGRLDSVPGPTPEKGDAVKEDWMKAITPVPTTSPTPVPTSMMKEAPSKPTAPKSAATQVGDSFGGDIPMPTKPQGKPQGKSLAPKSAPKK